MPWQLSYAASADLDNSELQTDVMRFMAILAFCLVAIFAIVQSMPLEPQPASEAAPTPKTAANAVTLPSPIPVVPVPVKTSEPKLVVKAPVPVLVPKSKPALPPFKATVVKVAKPKPVAKPATAVHAAPLATPPEPLVTKPLYVPMPEPDTENTPPVQAETPPAQAIVAETRQGLSLSFASDDVLRSLVSRRLVGLYAIDGKAFYQVTVNGQRFVFAPGAAPGQYHEMVYDTVPAEVSRSFESQLSRSARDVVWGVTLPAGTTRQLRRFVQTNFSGSLVITDDAQLALAGSG